ncbi:MAG: ABC transporter permease [Anaerolineales bacterium]|nr:ABC transporter permease [Anaerolineales bacterium]
MKNLQRSFKELLRYPSAIAGLIIVALLISVGIYAMITIPYNEAIRLWRGGEDVWYQNPKTAAPVWINWFTREKLPPTIVISTKDEAVESSFEQISEETSEYIYNISFDFEYDAFPQEIAFYFKNTYTEKQPFVSIYLTTPDDRRVRIADFGVATTQTYRMSQDDKLQRRLGDVPGQIGVLADPNFEDQLVPLKGTYTFELSYLTFEPDATVSAELVMHGLTHGIAGTDHLRRDLTVPLLWGIPVALAFGLVAALGTSVLTMIIAAVGVWYGSWVDELIQRITEVNLVLPFLSILIMVGTFYSRSIWVILGVTILLSIFTGGIKSYRAIFLQVKESTYIEAARAYGAGNSRIIFLYLVPRIVPLLIPGLVSSIPAFVFLEASLAVLGLGDPVLPTWGKIINDAQNNGALYRGLYYWILEPAVLLMITGLAFAMLGFSLDRVFNPRLRGL